MPLFLWHLASECRLGSPPPLCSLFSLSLLKRSRFPPKLGSLTVGLLPWLPRSPRVWRLSPFLSVWTLDVSPCCREPGIWIHWEWKDFTDLLMTGEGSSCLCRGRVNFLLLDGAWPPSLLPLCSKTSLWMWKVSITSHFLFSHFLFNKS